VLFGVYSDQGAGFVLQTAYSIRGVMTTFEYAETADSTEPQTYPANLWVHGIRHGNTLVQTVSNMTTHVISTFTANQPTANPAVSTLNANGVPTNTCIGNSGYFSIGSTGGTNIIKNLTVSCIAPTKLDWILIGDSITIGTGANDYSICSSEQTRKAFQRAGQNCLTCGSGGDTSWQALQSVAQLESLNPARIIYAYGVNDAAFGTNFTANITNFISSIGVPVVVQSPIACNNVDVTAIVTFGMTNIFTAANFVNEFSPTKTTETTLLNPLYDSGDGVHPGQTGHDLKATTLDWWLQQHGYSINP
jgi:lysophospholipase L1-like esterase